MTAAAVIEERVIGPQPGPQTLFLESTADIAIYGGSAGGGKTWALLLEPLRHFDNPRFGGVIFRRNTTQVRNEGGLWDQSFTLYSQLGCHPRESVLEWEGPTGWRMKFAHLEHEKTVFDWQGSEIPFIGWDELTHFSERMFFYMMSRNRGTSGVPGYMRATCNPDVDSWVRRFIDWWIGADGLPIDERSGVLRWFIRMGDAFVWGDSREELVEKYGDVLPKSVTFIRATLADNRILMEKDPSYKASLEAMSSVDRARLLGGNWNIRATAGTMFRREWFRIVEAPPGGWLSGIRFWDRAASIPTPQNPDPDWTEGLKMLRYPDGSYCIPDLKGLQDTPGKVEAFIKAVASHDGRAIKVMAQQDPGSAGVAEALQFCKMLAGYIVRTLPFSKDKVTRAKAFSAQAEAGNVSVVRGPWNERFFAQLENFPGTGHDDIIDAASGAFNELSGSLSMFDVK